MLLVAGADRTLTDTQAEPCGSGCGVARIRRGTRRSQGLWTTNLAGRLLPMGRGAGRFASALRKRPYGEALSGCGVRIGSHFGSEGALAATTPDRQPRLINGDSRAAAQDYRKTDARPCGAGGEDRTLVGCPTGFCREMVKNKQRHRRPFVPITAASSRS